MSDTTAASALSWRRREAATRQHQHTDDRQNRVGASGEQTDI